MKIPGSGENERLRARVEELESEIQRLQGCLVRDGKPRIGTLQEFKRECAKLAALYRRHGFGFSLAIIELGDAAHPHVPLTPAVRQWAAEVLLTTVRIEDSCYAIDAHRAAVLLLASRPDGARAFVERLRFRLATMPCPGTPPRFVTVSGGVAESHTGMAGTAALVRQAAEDLQNYRSEIGRQRRTFASDG